MERLGLNRKLIQKNNLKKSKRIKFIIFIICVIVPILIFNAITKVVEPTLMAMCTLEAKNIGILVSNEAIGNVMEGVTYEDLVTLEKDQNGKIIALRANVMEMSKMATQISNEMQKLYDTMEGAYVKIPVGTFTGNALLSSFGPNITVKIIPFGMVATDFKSEFVSAGINQVRHRIYLEVLTNVSVVAPLITKEMSVTTNISIAETILVGDVPDSFFNLNE